MKVEFKCFEILSLIISRIQQTISHSKYAKYINYIRGITKRFRYTRIEIRLSIHD